MKMMFEENEPVVASSDDIVITACPTLVEENRATQEFLWGYYFCIENNSSERIQLVGKSWNITDDKGNCFCDDSAGFKGEIPELEPGESFEFTSLAPLTSPHAVFYGSCRIRKEGRTESKDIKIPTFTMSVPLQQSACLN
jgi:protein apaG